MNSGLAHWIFQLCLLAALLAGLPQPVQALTLFDKTFTCPLDGKTSTYRAVNSYSQFSMQLDLRPIGALVAPVPLPTCKDSGFVIYRDDFDDAEIALCRRLVQSPEYRVLREFETDYFVAAYQAGKLAEDAWTVAILTLKATWEVQEDPAKYNHYAALALTRLEEAGRDYSRTGETGKQWWTAKLLVVNLHRRLGEFDRAEQLLAELPYDDVPGESGYRTLGVRLANLIARKNAAAAEVAPRDGR